MTEFSLVNVRGMDRQEFVDALFAMGEDDKRSIQAYLESKEAWTTELGKVIQIGYICPNTCREC